MIQSKINAISFYRPLERDGVFIFSSQFDTFGFHIRETNAHYWILDLYIFI